MQIELTNNTKSLLIVTLTSGMSVYLRPGQKSSPVDYIEVNGNQKIEKLRGSGELSITPARA